VISQTVFNRIVALRKEERTCREVSHIVGVSEATVWSAMRRANLAGKIRGKAENRPAASIEAAVDRYGSVTIEAGLNGGYIATLGNDLTGRECGTPASAIRSAATRA